MLNIQTHQVHIQKLKNTFAQGYPTANLHFEALQCIFWEIWKFWCPFHSFVCSCNLLFLFVSLDSVLWHIVMCVFEVVFCDSCHVYQAYMICMQPWCHFHLNSSYIGADQHTNFGNCLFWFTCVSARNRHQHMMVCRSDIY